MGLSHNRGLAFLGAPNQATFQNGVLAQLVEQRTFNPFVVGSIPAHPTKYFVYNTCKQFKTRSTAGFLLFKILLL
jgi:hypothetical protein